MTCSIDILSESRVRKSALAPHPGHLPFLFLLDFMRREEARKRRKRKNGRQIDRRKERKN